MCESEPRAGVTEEERREAEQLETELDKYFFTVFDGSSPEDVSHAKQLWTSLSLLPPLESRLVNADIRQRLPIAPTNHDETLLVVGERLQEARHQKQRQGTGCRRLAIRSRDRGQAAGGSPSEAEDERETEIHGLAKTERGDHQHATSTFLPLRPDERGGDHNNCYINLFTPEVCVL
ncbi:cilia- and flagella-associated protein HOATZ [Salvelinus sp. IW2-2015]|uniref:cilia- and flagella-associated protein HOATZ n=1 Tax=Salvelinus sp. IW2-2015 TaxID=2691554 RepID=UPI0038D433D0